jgi:hypothetical protein
VNFTLKAISTKKVTLLKWNFSILKNVIVGKKNFFVRPKSANYAIKLLFVTSNLSHWSSGASAVFLVT